MENAPRFNFAYALLGILFLGTPAYAQQFEPIRVDAGGAGLVDSEGDVWSPDTGYLDGAPVTLGGQVSGTQDGALFESLRYGGSELNYRFQVPNGVYQVRAHFAEMWSGAFAPGVRVFDIAAQGSTFASHVDVYREVGPYAALTRTFNVAVTDGTLDLAFLAVQQSPIVNALEIVATNAPSTPANLVASTVGPQSVTLTWAPSLDDVGVSAYELERCEGSACTNFEYANAAYEPPLVDSGLVSGHSYRYRLRSVDTDGNYSTWSAPLDVTTTLDRAHSTIRVNAGGPAYVDSSGNLWEADRGYSDGIELTVPQQIDGTGDSDLYRSLRWNNSPRIDYAFPVANGEYEVSLHFAEIYGGAFRPGGRVFGVLVEGELVFPEVDIYSEAGANTALIKKVRTNVTDGRLDISFVRGYSDNPLINAIEAIPLEIDEPPAGDTTAPGDVDGLSATAVSPSQVDLVWTAATDDVGVVSYSIERCIGVGCQDFQEWTTTTPDALAFSDAGLQPSTDYSYRVRANDAAGNRGGYSPVVEVRSYDPPPPVDDPPPPVDDPPPPVDDPPPPVDDPPPPVDDPPPPVDDPPPPVDDPPPPVDDPPPPVDDPPPPVDDPPPPVDDPPPPVDDPPPPVDDPPPPVDDPPPPVDDPPPPTDDPPPPVEDPTSPGEEPAA